MPEDKETEERHAEALNRLAKELARLGRNIEAIKALLEQRAA